MSNRSEVNPLRPYYIPPTIGEGPDVVADGHPFSSHGTATASSGYASKARDMFSDLDYNYLNDTQPSVVQSVKDLIDELIWKYTSVLMAQPFEVAKTVLQTRDQDLTAALSSPRTPEQSLSRSQSFQNSATDALDSDSDGEEPAYFTSNVPNTPTPLQSRSHSSRRGFSPSRSVPKTPSASGKSTVPSHYLNIKQPDSVLDVINLLWQKEGTWGVWKGSNATFLYTVLQSLMENWGRSFLSAILNVPDLGVKDDIDRLLDIASPYPWVSLFVAATAAVATGVALAPLDLVRTRLIMTPSTTGQRRTLATLRSLPSYLCHSMLFVPTVLHSLVHPLLTLSTPLVLRTRFMIDSSVSPMSFSVARFFASSAAVAVKLPIETALRRGQMAVLSSQDYLRGLGGKEARMDTVVPIGRYAGVFGTMYHITAEEGSREIPSKSQPGKRAKGKSKTTTQKGQGLEGLWRGWKVNWWGLVGLWTASVVGNSGEGEF